MGSRYLQLRLPLLGASSQLLDPTPPRLQVHWHHDPHLVCPSLLSRRGQKLRWHARPPLLAWHVRSFYLASYHEYCINVLHAI